MISKTDLHDDVFVDMSVYRFLS